MELVTGSSIFAWRKRWHCCTEPSHVGWGKVWFKQAAVVTGSPSGKRWGIIRGGKLQGKGGYRSSRCVYIWNLCKRLIILRFCHIGTLCLFQIHFRQNTIFLSGGYIKILAPNQWRDEYSPIWGLGMFKRGGGRFPFRASSWLFIFYQYKSLPSCQLKAKALTSHCMDYF